MLSLFNIKEKLFSKDVVVEKSISKTSKHFPSPLREWNNSIYVYNKNSISKIPSTSYEVNKIIKNYFNLYNKRIESKMRTKRLLMRFRKLSSNRFFISNGSFKHTNNKVYINLYIFNRQKVNHLITLKKWFLRTILSKSRKRNSSVNIIKKINLINKKGIDNLISLNKHKFLLIKTLNTIKSNNKYNLNAFKDIILYTENFYKKLMKKSLIKIRMYVYYKQLIYLNRSKLNYTYLQYLNKYLEKIYNKNVEFNIINIKKFYLNSDILSKSIALKLARNRRKIYRYMTLLKEKIITKKKTIIINKKKPIKDLYVRKNLSNSVLLQKHIIKNLKYRHITGFRIEAKGRLTKRFTASRSISKFRYKGNLLNIDSSYKGWSSVLLKGNLRSNTQYTKIKSKSRIGSFGIKGWISGN